MILSSANGVDAVESRLQTMGRCLARRPESLKIAAVGRKTARRLDDLGVPADFVPPTFVADSLIDHFPCRAGGYASCCRGFRAAGARCLLRPSAKPAQELWKSQPMNRAALRRFHPTRSGPRRQRGGCRQFQQWENGESHRCSADPGHRQRTDGIGVSKTGRGVDRAPDQPALQGLLGRVDAEACPHDLDGLVKRAFKPYSGAEPDRKPSRQDILGVSRSLNAPTQGQQRGCIPWATAPRSDTDRASTRGCLDQSAELTAHLQHPLNLHIRSGGCISVSELQDSWFPRSIPPSAQKTRWCKGIRSTFRHGCQNLVPTGEGSILVRMPSQGCFRCHVRCPTGATGAGTGRDQA